MDRRLKLHEVLCETLESRNVYYQPPNGLVMKYPAIVYKREEIKNTYADGGVYRKDTGYMATVIDKNPDSEIVQRMSELPFCQYVRHYAADNLNHDVFIIYY